ncbi:hypothetical protein SAZ10_31625 [Mesorhizobium sp. BAC0120]|uniref:hypothetical protein n=1 Tax=Mesorhizobium sp. BAC0120 TaxID=3090670 RepID=UPI00298CB262|nr:hypothetical protein [Mesorhizobium sp. BAC0120]MDW6026319.1 hypothetical protein [Mesorhizobium sp. BAC0120]
MTPDQFRKLTKTYGAEPRRWPQGTQEAALGFMKSHPAEAQVALAEATQLDGMLDRHIVAAPDSALGQRIISSAPAARAIWQHARLWWQGAAIAGLGIAGALAGALMIGIFRAPDAAEYNDGAHVVTAFDDISYELDE